MATEGITFFRSERHQYIMEFRQAKNSDLPRLTEMYLALYRHISGPETSSLKAMNRYANKKLHQKQHFTFVAEENGELIGALTVRLLSKTRGDLIDAYVEPVHRRRGILSKLEGRVRVFCRKRGITSITLDVQTSNEEGLASWKSLGYQIYEVSMKKEI